ncbi:competence protein ComM [Clostridium tepidiprofundi DSM 19306]|uniref:Competence protein ComM n=1 Tax=Clostridium tepidiprofundi DSM 19306 TaxID=1121338 RepID=A0A151B793_9CLOT|nr:competence protein ComM [Clostridium tepidiprofundi DSM 19306]
MCSEYERKRYLNKLSGPLIDRIDMFTFVSPSKYSDIKKENMGETSSAIKKRVSIARDIQKTRFKYESINTNSQMNVKLIKRYCELDEKCESIMKKIFTNYKISTRAYYRILKVSRTIADLKNRENILQEDIIEAINYRKFINGNII